ncbi:hypothetical protein ACFLT1_05015 [Bacteroidota bacterium]
MKRQYLYFILILLGLVSGRSLYGQETDYDQLLQRVDTIENPVYKPVISFGYGLMNFMGDVRNNSMLPVAGNPAIRANVSTYIDNGHYFTVNFYFMTTLKGLSVDQRSYANPVDNWNFNSSVFSIGATARYEFGHLFSSDVRFRPYLAVGVEQLNFQTKLDLKDTNGNRYYYWQDGSIRDIQEGTVGGANLLTRDFVYETNLSQGSNAADLFGLNYEYSPRTIGFPAEIGFTLKISPRVFFSLGTEYHYLLTDNLDNVTTTFPVVDQSKNGNDAFLFTHATLQFDLFSEPKTKTVDLDFALLEIDPLFFEDEDGDFVLDNADMCPGTPYGIAVDTTGCPLDADKDGIADYLDKQPDSPRGSWVDDDGIAMTEEEFLLRLQRQQALNRGDLELYLELMRQTYLATSIDQIPEKFKVLDSDGDGFISYDELMMVLDGYFDFKVDFSIDDLRELNEYFFNQ